MNVQHEYELGDVNGPIPPINQLAIIFALIQLRNSFYSGRQEGAKSATLNTVITDSLIYLHTSRQASV